MESSSAAMLGIAGSTLFAYGALVRIPSRGLRIVEAFDSRGKLVSRSRFLDQALEAAGSRRQVRITEAKNGEIVIVSKSYRLD